MTTVLILAMTRALAILVLVASLASAAPAEWPAFVTAIARVESGDRDVTGDRGAAIGPMQIHRDYFRDSRVSGRYEQCRDRAYAERVMRGYLRRWCPAALAKGDWKTCSRVHHMGGTNPGRNPAESRRYWRRVAAGMKAEAERCTISMPRCVSAAGLNL